MSKLLEDDAPVAADPPPEPVVRRAPGLQRRIRQMLLGVFLLDAGVLLFTSALAWAWRGPIDRAWVEPYPYRWWPALGPALIVVWLLCLVVLGAYRTRTYGAGFEEFRTITIASAMTFGLACTVGFLSHDPPSRGYPVLFFVIGTPLLLLVRYVDRQTLHLARRQGRLAIRMVAVGSPDAVSELADVLARSPWMGYRIIGMCVPQGAAAGETDIAVLGGVDDVREVALTHRAHGVVVAGGSYSSARDLRRLGWELQGLGLQMLVVPALTDIAGPRVHMRHVAGLPFVQVEEPQSDRAGGWTKRLFDVVVSLLVLVALSPLLLLTALVIKLQDRGPIFYRQTRSGINGTEFEMVKFRSMVVGADRMRADLDEANESDGVLFKLREDPRVTRFGRFMRKYSIDELPQLFNVLRGEMSLVGPRPPFPDEVARYEQDAYRRLMVRPGMTGLWQVSGRSDLPWSEAVRLDLYYVDNWSMVIDLVIVLKTVKAVLLSKGAY